MKTKRAKSLITTSLALALPLLASTQTQAAAQPTTFVHLFEWNWQDIAQECESYLGPKGYANANLGKNCATTNFDCAIAIKHNNLRNSTTTPWKTNDNYLDWYGAESGQNATAKGTPLDWTTDVWLRSWGALRTTTVDGYGEDPLNIWGQHYWMLDADMNCSQTINGHFEVKAFIKNGQGWEYDIAQVNTPYATSNHVARCGKVNKFDFNAKTVEIRNF